MTQEERRQFEESFRNLDQENRESCFHNINYPKTIKKILDGENIRVHDEDLQEVIQILRERNDGGGNAAITPSPYNTYIQSQQDNYGETSAAELKQTIDALCDLTEKYKSGLVVGRVQSGKTATYIGLIAALRDRKWNIVISLTSNKINLGKQTSDRLIGEFDQIELGNRRIQALNLIEKNAIRDNLLWDIYLKNSSQLTSVRNRLEHIIPILDADKTKILILDDEADNCSQNTQSQKKFRNALNQYIDGLGDNDPKRKLLTVLRDNPEIMMTQRNENQNAQNNDQENVDFDEYCGKFEGNKEKKLKYYGTVINTLRSNNQITQEEYKGTSINTFLTEIPFVSV